MLKTQDYKENDKLLWLFTEKIGKVCAIAKGAKKIRVNSCLLPRYFVLENTYYLEERVYII
ncbi:recombination protein O N-terminal domain-containing protein [Clostridium haemolyticum]|uniref:recombination protein O N-terminal domain-containing protein n=1 Tax=Clostridium haemolyticum TaxID=84025 RepID=UPI0023DDF1D1|nr:recombination protein O N-terminal domain-containing protein [Clostridium haemolyticum]